MAFDETLAARIRDALARRKNVEEKKMFGGVGFLLNGNLLVGVWKDSLIVRLGQDEGDGDRVGDEVLTRHSLLPAVGGRAVAERPVDQLEIEPVGMALEHRPELGGGIGQERRADRHGRPLGVVHITNVEWRLRPAGSTTRRVLGRQPRPGQRLSRSPLSPPLAPPFL